MTDGELNLDLAEELTAIMTASEENIPEVPKVSGLQAVSDVINSAEIVTIEPPESASAIEAVIDESELALQEVESVLTQPDADDFAIVDEPAPKAGFVKRWARKIVGWVKRVFKWGKK